MEISEIVTKSDLLKVQAELKTMIMDALNRIDGTGKKWLRSAEVMEMLGLSSSGLQNLRISGTIPFTKLGGIIYYDYTDILQVLESNKRNST